MYLALFINAAMAGARMGVAVVVVLLALVCFSVVAATYAVRSYHCVPRPPWTVVPVPVTTFDDFVRRGGAPPATTIIPPTLWRTGPHALSKLSTASLRAMATFQRYAPHLEQVYCTDADCRAYIMDRHREWLPAYDTLVPGAFRADLWRLVILYDFGGVYCDMGFVALAPLTDLVDITACGLAITMDKPMAAVVRCAVFQGFLAARPGHPVIKAMLDVVLDNIAIRYRGLAAIDVTGPVAVGRAFWKFFGIPQSQWINVGRWLTGPSPADTIVIGQHHETTISDYTGRTVIRCKFFNYRNAMYRSNQTLRYDRLHAMDAVFKVLPVLTPPTTFPDARTIWRVGPARDFDTLPEAVRDAASSVSVLAPAWRQTYITGSSGLQDALPRMVRSGGLYLDPVFSLLQPLDNYLTLVEGDASAVVVVDAVDGTFVPGCCGGVAGHAVLRALAAGEPALPAAQHSGAVVWVLRRNKGVIETDHGKAVIYTKPLLAQSKASASRTVNARAHNLPQDYKKRLWYAW